jgi:prolyl oligopeptidase
LVLLVSPALLAQKLPTPPETPREEVKETLNGVEITDPYRWLEDQDSSKTRAWIEAQNKFTQSQLATLPGREEISNRLSQLVKIDTLSMPSHQGNRYFFSRKRADEELSSLCVREGANGKDEVLIDPRPMSPDGTTSVSYMGFTHDGKLMTYGVRKGGEDEVEVHVYDVDTRKEMSDRFPKARYSGFSFVKDNSGFYYSKYDSAIGPRVYYHTLGKELASDQLVFGDGYKPGTNVSAAVTDDGHYMVLYVAYGSAGTKTDVYFQDLVKKTPIVPLVNDVDAVFGASFAGDTIVIQTNWNAPNGRVMVADAGKPARDQWREIIKTGDSVIQSVSLAGDRMFVKYLENVNSRVLAFDLAGKSQGEIKFPTLGSVSAVGGEWGVNDGYYAFSSYHVPQTIYRYDVSKGTSEVWWRAQAPVESDRLVTEQVWYKSKDGVKVPMFLVHQKDMPLDGNRPTYLTGYGGFRSSSTPAFNASAVLWAEHGGLYAVPNLRGGGEFGEDWHKAGMLDKKQNVFDDFTGAAEWLVASKYTKPDRLAIAGGSNGGLLVGAFMTQRPDLCRAVLCSVPLLDMLRYHKFLVAKFWVPEYGSADDPNQFKFLYAYSPYHHVTKGTKYPAVLFVSGDSDTRVAPLHARKMCALMQWANGSDRPILLHYDVTSGHSGGKPISKVIEDRVDELAFLYWQLGENPAAPKGTGGAGGR